MTAALLVGLLGVCMPLGRTARADVFDLSLQRLVLAPDATAGEKYASPDSPRNQMAGVNSAYRTFVSELSTALAPRFMTPSDTLGYSGFHFDVDYSFTTYNNRSCVSGETRDKCPWQYAVDGAKDGSGNRKPLPGMLHTLSVWARKGIWLPIPSFEIGAGATTLLQSSIYAVQAYAKFAIHEGFHRWPLPSIAARGSVLRVLGTDQIDLTMAQLDISMSKSFGLGGTMTLVPYVGAAFLWSIFRGQVIDLTPNIDAYRQGPRSEDLNNNAVFSTQSDILRYRFFGGFRLNYSKLVLTAEYVFTACGELGTDSRDRCYDFGKKQGEAHDLSGNQHSFSVSAGFLF